MVADKRLALLAAVMREAGVSASDILDKERVEERIRLQKIVYLLRASGAVPEFKSYEFTLYIFGPYSPRLADDYYLLARRGDSAVDELAAEARLPEYAAWLVRRLRGEPVEMLELAATLLDILLAYREAGLLPERHIEMLMRAELPRRIALHLRSIKPWARDEDVRKALRLLIETGVLRKALRV